MRVKFGNHIDFCRRITHSEGSGILIITTMNDVYTVDCITNGIATTLYAQMLVHGYIDVSGYKWSN